MYTKHGWFFPDEDTHFADMLDKNIAKGNQPVYQEPVRSKSLQFVHEKGVALDIGANIGLWCRDLCDQFDRVIAFEPVDQFRTCLLKNIQKNNLEIRPWALGEEDTYINMVVTEGNTGHSHVDNTSTGEGNTPMYKLDSLTFDRIDYVKIDCEGYEVNIIRGAEQTFKTFQPVVVVEQKLHKDTGITENTQFGAAELLKSWGARELARVRHDVILGW